MLSIPGVELEAELGRGSRGVVYRARSRDLDVAVKIPLLDNASQLVQFRREGSLLACVQHPGLAKVHEVGSVDGMAYIVSELLDGAALSDELRSGPLPFSRVERLGLTLAGALSAIHAQGLVHRDVKPSNVIWSSSGPKLIDFGLAALDTALTAGADQFAGTLLYASPEQTGMLKRPVDARSDLYSLGVLLFESLIGRPPFWGEPSDLIRQHAVMPPPLLQELNPRISNAMAAIVARLLAKDPDDRYQSAAGLLHDLESLRQLERLSGTLPLDQSARILPGIPLVGRSELVDQLHAQWESIGNETSGARGAAVLIKGPSGSGKSRVVRELLERISDRTLVLQGKTQQNDSAPYHPFRQAVEGSLRQMQRLPAELLKVSRRRLAAITAERRGPMLALTPELSTVLSDEPAPELDGATDGLYATVADWFAAFATSRGGAVLVLEDVHWLDPGSVQIVLRLATQLRDTPLLLVLTTREDTPMSEELKRGNLSTQQIQPLDAHESEQFISLLLGGSQVDPRVAEQVARRSQGNPFALEQYVRACLDQGLLRPYWGTWVADLEELTHLRLPEDVFQLVMSRLEELGPDTLGLLRAAAVLGSTFGTAALPALSGLSPDEVRSALSAALQVGVLERREHGELQFAHDRLREALLSQIPPDQLQALHLQAAHTLEPLGDDYAIAQHYRLGQGPREKIASTSLRAARRALAEMAYESAYQFLGVCLEVDPQPSTRVELAHACEMSGRGLEAFQQLGQAVAEETHPLKRAQLRLRRCRLGLTNAEWGAGGPELRKALEEAGGRAPAGGWQSLARTAGLLGRWALARGWRGRGQSDDLPSLVQAELYEQLMMVTLFRGDFAGAAEAAARGALVCARLRLSRESVRNLCQLALLFSSVPLKRPWAFLIERAEEQANRLSDVPAQRAVGGYRGICLQLQHRPEEGARELREVTTASGARMPLADYTPILATLSWTCLMQGHFQELLEMIRHAKGLFHLTSEFPTELAVLQWHEAVALAALGKGDEIALAIRHGALPVGRSRTLIEDGSRLLVAYFSGDVSPALDPMLERVRQAGASLRLAPEHLLHAYIAVAYITLFRCEATEESQRTPALRAFTQARNELRRVEVRPMVGAHYRVVESAYLRLTGKLSAAQRKLDEALRMAELSDSAWATFEATCERGRLLQAKKQIGASRRAFESAFRLALQNRWTPLGRQLTREASLKSLASTENLRESLRSITASRISSGLLQRRQLEALRELTLATARVYDPDRLAQIVLTQVVHLLGAQRAVLVGLKDGSSQVLAARTPDGPSDPRESGYSRTIVERVLSTGQSVIVNGREEGHELGSRSVVLQDLRSILAVPLRLRDELWGALYLDNNQAQGLYNQDDREILEVLASYIAVGLETARGLKAELRLQVERDQRRHAETLAELAATLSGTTEPRHIAEAVSSVVKRELEGATCALYWRKRDPLQWSDELPELLFRALEEGQPLQDGRLVAVPCLGGEGPVGGLVVERPSADWKSRDLALLRSLGGQAALALQKARLWMEMVVIATTDALTGVANRRHFFELAARELSEVRRHASPVSVIILDVDHFKRFNDSYGHHVGDQVLTRVAEVLNHTLRREDVLARYGGEEFVVLLPRIALAEAADGTCERLRRAVERCSVESDGGPLSVTISLGVSAYTGPEDTLEAMLKRADAALYEAKASGRNRYVRDSTVPV